MSYSLGHRQLHPSLQALVVRVAQFIGTPHIQFMLLASSPLLFRKLMAAIVLLAKLIGLIELT